MPPKEREECPQTICAKILSDKEETGQLHHLATLLSALTQEEDDGKMNAIWRASLLRTSSRPVDMVFSIMGLLDVALDPNAFDRNDRRSASLRLLQELAKRGHRAEWLGMAPNIRTPAGLSTIPM